MSASQYRHGRGFGPQIRNLNFLEKTHHESSRRYRSRPAAGFYRL